VLLVGELHHLTDDECIKLLSAIRVALSEFGRAVTIDPALVSGQHLIARGLAKLDRGRHVRTPPRYKTLIETSLEVESETV